jgi:ABC-type multidrug transport system fused ATPase/permease subunit
MKFFSLIQKHQRGIFFVAVLIIIENLAWIVEPTLFGKLIDGFLQKISPEKLEDKYAHVFPLILWITAYIINSGSGTLRRYYEPRVFQKIYVDLVTKIAETGNKLGIDSSITAGRAHLSQQYVTFVQYRIPEIVEQTISISGAIIALAIFDYRISLVCLLISVPLIIMSILYSNNVVKLHSELHDKFELVYDTFAKREALQVTNVYSSMARLQEQIASWGAANFGIMRIVLLIIFLFVIYIAIDLDNFTLGNIYSIVAYLWTFITSVEYIPELMESRTSLKDISRRLKADERSAV